jgi:hypothetical protein
VKSQPELSRSAKNAPRSIHRNLSRSIAAKNSGEDEEFKIIHLHVRPFYAF